MLFLVVVLLPRLRWPNGDREKEMDDEENQGGRRPTDVRAVEEGAHGVAPTVALTF